MWAAETFGMMAEICQIYGPGASTYISQDDKSSVHIGVIAAKKQSAMLMNMRCRMRGFLIMISVLAQDIFSVPLSLPIVSQTLTQEK